MATKYEYNNILGQMIQSEVPQEKTDGNILYQKTTTEYDNAGNMIAKEEQVDRDRKARTEYTYDERGGLVMVKDCSEDEKAQYVYDVQGNKVRQFTSMTSPLTINEKKIKYANNKNIKKITGFK